MNILFFEDSSRTINGGGQRISGFVISALKTTKNKICYVDFISNQNLLKQLASSDIVISLYNKKKLKTKNNIISNIYFIIYFIPNFVKLFLAVKNNSIDIIYTTTKKSLLLGSLIAMACKVQYFYHAHMLLQDKKSDRIILYFIKKAKICIAVSDFVANDYKSYGLESIITIPNPLDVSHVYSSRSLKNRKTIQVAFVGTLIKEKGVEFLLQCMNDFHESNVLLNIYGTGPLLEYLDCQYSSNSNIIFHGFVENIDKVLENNVDILVLPTVIKEAAPTIIQQAMAKGIPIITTDIGGQSSFVKNLETGILVPISNSFEISNAIKYFLFNPEDYVRMSTNCLVQAKQFTTLDDFNNSINSLLQII
jgi:glycosyltransferase involved in cell wall biosynthesis